MAEKKSAPKASTKSTGTTKASTSKAGTTKASTSKANTSKASAPQASSSAASAPANAAQQAAGKFSSIEQIHWIAGLTVAVVLSHILALIAIAVTNQWILVVLLSILNLIVAAAVGFAVRLTSSVTPGQTFLAAFATAGLGVHVLVSVAGQRYDDFGRDFINAYSSAPLSGYVIFFGLVAALVATVRRRK